jgi:hypothetical protein
MARVLAKSIFTLLVLNVYIMAHTSVTELKYEGGISLYGRVGTADVKLEEDFTNNRYKMKVTTQSVGLVKRLSSNRKDIYLSEGRIESGAYVPTKFTKLVIKDDYYEKTTYDFDYKNGEVVKRKVSKKVKYINEFDIDQMKIVEKKTFAEEDVSEYIDFKNNDYLSLFLNLRKGNLKNGALSYIDKKDKDSVNLISQNLFEVQKDYGEDTYRIGFLNDEGIFFKEAVAENIAFYGDAYIKKVYEKNNIIN